MDQKNQAPRAPTLTPQHAHNAVVALLDLYTAIVADMGRAIEAMRATLAVDEATIKAALADRDEARKQLREAQTEHVREIERHAQDLVELRRRSVDAEDGA